MTYTAITIGPILETLNLTSKPAGLWAASYMFSELSKQICKQFPQDDIVSPFFESGERCGAGLFPDRIILKTNATSLEKINNVIINAKRAVASSFGIDEGYLCGYLQAHAIRVEADGNPIKDLSPFVAMLENERYFRTEEPESQLLAVIEKKQQDDESACVKVKECALVQELGENWPLWEDKKKRDKIRSLAHIASNNKVSFRYEGEGKYKKEITVFESPLKKHRYYAVIQADGDNIGAHITGLGADEITDFSKKCWTYSKQTAEIAQNYGGVTIYAGGDDLLAIVPLENAKSETVFDLIADIRDAFKAIFSSVGSLSFGVAVRFHRYPLYESIKAAQSLLFDKAKQVPGKNAIAFDLQKHSGQSIGLLFPYGNENFVLTELKNQIKKVVEVIDTKSAPAADIGNLLHSIMSHLRIYERVFVTAIDKDKDKDKDKDATGETVKQAFKNIFGEEMHKEHTMIQGAQKLLSYSGDSYACTSLIEDVPDHDHRLTTLDAMLRLLKFFTEQGEEDDDRA
jgi:CRISPR-associated protein Cmr2